ncbi:MAG: serine/threonine-protein phosphatase [Bacteroidales bacterium]|nr:serine/threonine-protein phosphatase [Bacteroidales bacterium]
MVEGKKANSSRFKLNTLLNIIKVVSNNSSIEELLKTYSSVLLDEFNINSVLIFNYDNRHWNIILRHGIDDNACNGIDPERDFKNITEYDSISSLDLTQKLPGLDYIIPITQNTKPLAYILIGDENEGKGTSPIIKNLNSIQILSNHIIVAIENKRQEGMRKELEMASRMQSLLIPNADIFDGNGNIAVCPFYLPHYEVGGDYYDFDYLSDDEMFFCIADVAGKGMAAALLMSNFQASLKALFVPETELSTLVNRLNKIIVKNSNGERFITLFIGRYNFNTHDLRYVNAGHNPPILFDKEAMSLEYLTKGCPGIGMMDDIPSINEGHITLTHNTKLLCFTDGVVEMEREGIPDYGQTVVERTVRDNLPVRDNIKSLLRELNIQRSNTALLDDVTLLGIDFIINK